MNNSPTRRGDADVIAFSAFNGLRDDVPAERFNGADTASDKRNGADLNVAINVDIDASGAVSRRAGYAQVLSGAAHSLWANPAGTVCLLAQGANLRMLQPDYSSTALRTLAGVGERISYACEGERVYFSNGVDTGVVEAGSARSWGLAVPNLPGVAATVGTLPSGRYQFAMTHVRAGGQESGAPLAGVIDLAAGAGLVFTLPVSTDPGVAAKRVYLSAPDGETLYLAFEAANATTTASYTGDTYDLVEPLATQFMGPAPAGQLVAYYRGRMWVAAGDLLYPSEPFAYELFDYRNYLRFDGRITLLAPMTDKERSDDTALHSGFFVGTDTSCGIVVGAAPDDFAYVPKTTYGAVLGALDYVDGALLTDASSTSRQLPMWLTTEGVCVGRPDMDIENLTRSKYGFTARGQGAALFMPGPNRFIATANF
jgi:hypothetical protein